MKSAIAVITIVFSLLLSMLVAPVYAGSITAIQEINASPARFDGRTVTLRGVTKDPTRIPVIDLKAYVLEDNTGEIIILTSDNLPEMGRTITVRVRIDNLAVIKGEALGTTVVELQRYEQIQNR
ncbi:hypothetical protein SAMN05216326_12634 [Nitrosomonas marina]|uniref:DUF5666 domain-containing protein n=1 Tax=Nitrosomonas marina TaxID=917 RepID=A0A1I0ECH9_9PROT|nr:hypothetical protein [Nitrosomonas marina]SET42984.1 hypothetical protein SAMN05216326_12634 [Nitrosomonas marina]